MESKIMELLEDVKKANEFNLDGIIKEEIQEFKKAIEDYNRYSELVISNHMNFDKKVNRKRYEEVIFEACDVWVVLSQLYIPLDEALDFNLEDEEIELFYEIMDGDEKELFLATIHFKLARTLARNKSCGYYE